VEGHTCLHIHNGNRQIYTSTGGSAVTAVQLRQLVRGWQAPLTFGVLAGGAHIKRQNPRGCYIGEVTAWANSLVWRTVQAVEKHVDVDPCTYSSFTRRPCPGHRPFSPGPSSTCSTVCAWGVETWKLDVVTRFVTLCRHTLRPRRGHST
jgi:hypothetical protein